VSYLYTHTPLYIDHAQHFECRVSSSPRSVAFYIMCFVCALEVESWLVQIVANVAVLKKTLRNQNRDHVLSLTETKRLTVSFQESCNVFTEGSLCLAASVQSSNHLVARFLSRAFNRLVMEADTVYASAAFDNAMSTLTSPTIDPSPTVT
jgi:hypothetical protein